MTDSEHTSIMIELSPPVAQWVAAAMSMALTSTPVLKTSTVELEELVSLAMFLSHVSSSSADLSRDHVQRKAS